MKRIITLLTVISLGLGAMAQTVENIRVEQDGENILVHYRIGGSTDAQTFKAGLSCSVDGGRQFEPITVIGDVGENIRGGKSNYTIIWDVFEELDEIGEVEFFVSVDLTNDLSPERTQAAPVKMYQTEREETGMNYYLAYTGSTLCPYGFSTGVTYKKWGGYLSFRYGADEQGTEFVDWRIYVAGVFRQILEKGKYKLYVNAGAGVINEYYEEYTQSYYYDYNSLIIDGGLVNVIGKFSLTLGVEYINADWIQPVFGLGYLFPIRRKVKR